MRRPKVFVGAALVVVLLITAAIAVPAGRRVVFGPSVRPVSSRPFTRTAERLARGRYLVTAVTGCLNCHSPHDWTRHEAPIPAGWAGAGQDLVSWTLPGHVVAPNLTRDLETGTGAWSDDTLGRAIREGVGHDGRALFPMMPFQQFRTLSDEDLASIVVFLRSLPPVRHPLPTTRLVFPVRYLIRMAPQPITQAVAAPDVSTPVKRGAYLAAIAACTACHTPQQRGEPISSLPFAGGFVFEGPWGRVASANLTPDPSGIPYYDAHLFVETIRNGHVKARMLNQIMPWHVYRNMTDDDLDAIFRYLQTLSPVRHHVDNAQPPTFCPFCKNWHGAGDLNQSSRSEPQRTASRQ
jgi:mono/diheme cytochrome c family protein